MILSSAWMRTMQEHTETLRQSGVIPYRLKNETDVQVMLVTSRGSGRWIFPKGNVEPYLTPAESARKEAAEEAGVIGQVELLSLGTYTTRKHGQDCEVVVYPMHVQKMLSRWKEAKDRDRKWFDLKEARKRVKRDKKMIELLKQLEEQV